MRGFFLTIGAALLFAAGCGAALTWDGSAYLYELLASGRPFVAHSRYITVPLHWPTLAVAGVTGRADLVQLAFGLSYAAIPLLALGLSWLIVRRSAPALFIWPVLGIGLAMLPGQLFFVAEANIALQLFWPLLLIVLLRVPNQFVPLLLALLVALALSHPFAIGLLLLAALVAAGLGRGAPDRRKLWLWAGALALVALLDLALLSRARDPYEAEQLTPLVLQSAYTNALAGLPLLALGMTWLAALVVAIYPQITPITQISGAHHSDPATQRLPTTGAGRWLGRIAVGLVALAGVALLLWARDLNAWRNALDYRYVTVLTSAPLLALAIWEGWRAPRAEADARTWQQRRPLVPLVGAVFALVLVVQSASWYGLTTRLRDTIAGSPWKCISTAPLEWVKRTPLNHWSVGTAGVIIQGQTPRALVLDRNGCGDVEVASALQLTPWIAPRWDGGWFDMGPLRGALVGELEYAQGCSYMMGTGWHQTETDGPYWWRWTDGQRARIRVLTEQPIAATLTGQIETLRAPNQIAVIVNGTRQQTIDLEKPALQPLRPVTVQLQPGSNQIDLVSGQPSEQTQGRALAFSVAGLTVNAGTPETVCRFHP